MTPATWTQRRVDELCRVTRGASPRPIIEWIAPAGVPWIKIGDASSARSRTITRTREYIRAEGAHFSVRVAPGDLIVSNSATPGIPKFVGLDACIHDGWLLLRDFDDILPEYLYYRVILDRSRLIQQGNGSVFTNLKTDILKSHVIDVPPIEEQRGIAATLGALDDKIESNRRVVQLLRCLGQALVAAAGLSDEARLRDLTLSIARGVTPKYADDDADSPIVINQKCVRDGRVSDAQARRMIERQVAEEKRVFSGDILVNSTGTGTLGRVGRWHSGEVFADSHVSIVKADPTRIGPTLLAYLMFPRERDIEGMATGSTGQTELSPTRLGDLILDVPRPDARRSLEPVLSAFESRAASLESEMASLSRLRDTLLPELLSGRVRVPEAGEAASA